MSQVDTRVEHVRKYYQTLALKLESYRKQCGRPLTYAEKVVFSHLDKDDNVASLKRGESFIMLRPDRVAMQDATAQMALLQFMQSGKKQVSVPSTVHCDHLILARSGATKDMDVANEENAEVFNFLKSSSAKYGLGFWGPGAGIIHQVVLENYAWPGGLMIGTDSHTPNAGGLGMAAVGVGGADAVDVMAGQPWELLNPGIIGVHLKGSFQPWTAPKDIILKVLEILTVKGGTNRIIEYFGEGTETISATGKATITNMGAELGATTSLFPYDEKMANYLKATGREAISNLADQYKAELCADPEVLKDPKSYYDQVIEIDLNELEPYIVGPHSPDKARPVSKMPAEVKKEDYPPRLSACLVGSCTNSSYEDIYKAAKVASSALNKGIRSRTRFFISPGSAQIYATIRRDGLLHTLESFGGTVLANACGPCIGQWRRDDMPDGERNSIVTSFNRNFRGRNDANKETLSFIASPEMVVAYAATGDLRFNPLKDSVIAPNGEKFKLTAPTAPELPKDGFITTRDGYEEPPQSSEHVSVEVEENSERLQILSPFTKWDKEDFKEHQLLARVQGKCTTDHISPAGKWLRFRGHLDKISDNMLLGAQNAFHKEAGQGTNHTDNSTGTLTSIARNYKTQNIRWVVVGDENYGEGSSREHAAMSPRFLGASTVLVKSFARIHETNLKKQGVLALTFKDAKDYDRVLDGDKVSVSGLSEFAPGKDLTVTLTHKDGKTESFAAKHSYNKDQIQWFQAGSALNILR
ncbi:MAG: aconitate hydratase [Oligoflexales bacterium]